MDFRLGAIPTDICKQDFERSLWRMQQDGLLYADIEAVFGKMPGTHTEQEQERIQKLLHHYHIQAQVIGGFTFRNQSLWSIDVGDLTYRNMLEELRRQIEFAQLLGCRMIRTLVFSKQACLWGENGAELRNGYHNRSWPKMLKLFEAPVRMVEDAGMDLIFETGVNTVLTSGWLSRKFVEDLGSSHLKILWDPANMLINREYPDTVYEEIKEHIAHIHIKDGIYDANRSTIVSAAVGQGDMKHYLEGIREKLIRDHYSGVISLENFYIPKGQTTEEGYLASVPAFKQIFASEA